jgi:hydroxymethylbilane synthase
MNAVVVSVSGSESVQSEMQAPVETPVEADQFGKSVAADLFRKGADHILAAIQAKKMTRPADLEQT